MMITSRDNPIYKHIKKLMTDKRAREDAGVYVVCGEPFLLREALAANAKVETVYAECVADLTAVNVQLMSPDLLRSLMPVDSTASLLFTVQLPKMMTCVDPAKRYLVLDGVADPGNAGTLLRTAAAFGLDGVIALEGTVNFYNDKVVRAASGALFTLDLLAMNAEELVSMKVDMYVSVVPNANETVLQPQELRGMRGCLVIGNEARGVSEIMRSAATQLVTVPIYGDSLNAAVAGGILMYEFSG